jgi:hypothetical protein
MSVFRRVIMGAGYLPGYGAHPGTGAVVFLILLTGLAGSHQGLAGFVGGSLIGTAVYGPMWIAGCLSRAKSYLRLATPATPA